MVEIKGAAAFKAKLRKVMPTIEAEVNTKFRKLARLVFTDLVMNSPQWSGSLASSWHIGGGGFNRVGNSDWRIYANEPYQMGDDPAVTSTLLREVPKIDNYTYKDTIKITNAAPYASEVEAGQGPNGRPIRDENILAEYGGVAMIGYVNAKYNNLNGKKLA